MMKVAGLQLDISWQEPAINLERAELWIRRAADQGAKLITLPEMFATGFSMDVGRASAARMETEDLLRRLATSLQVTLIAGTAEVLGGDSGGRGANVALLVDPEGGVHTYHKIHPFSFAGEHERYQGGDRVLTVSCGETKVSPFVCYDLRFPEIFRAVAESTHLIVVIASWPDLRGYAWRSLLVARAIENQCYVLGVNRVGEGGGQSYRGDSMLIDPLGEVMASARGAEGIVGGEVDVAHVEQVRGRFPFLRDRRVELYHQLLGR